MVLEQTDMSTEIYLFVHKDLKGSPSRGKLIHEKNMKLKKSPVRLPLNGCVNSDIETSQHYFVSRRNFNWHHGCDFSVH
jgi:hypothetical protein